MRTPTPLIIAAALAGAIIVSAGLADRRLPTAVVVSGGGIAGPLALEDGFDSYDEYGYARGRHRIVEGVVRRNETLSDLLRSHGSDAADVARLADASRGVFEVRSIRSGRPYRLYFAAEDDGRGPVSLIYHASSTSYVVFDVSGETGVTRWNRPVVVRQHTVDGVVNSSLYETLQEIEADPGLANELAEIFAWQIDFYHLHRGDSFTAVYDERFVGGERVGAGTVHAARFRSAGREFFAFHFDKQGAIAYFDEEGNSLRKTFLAAPVKYSRISSRYTGRRFHPVLRRYRSHLGTDYAAPYGTPIRATGDGEVVEAMYKKGNGRYVKIRHNGTYTTAYLHMSKHAARIKPGKFVRQGDIIGYVGSTGLARGPHVCYRFWKHGRQVDPLRETFQSAEPVSEANRDVFDQIRIARLSEIGTAAVARALPAYAFALK